jgi:hypothetical protein
MGFRSSRRDECLFYDGKTIFIVYTDDTIPHGICQGGWSKKEKCKILRFRTKETCQIT